MFEYCNMIFLQFSPFFCSFKNKKATQYALPLKLNLKSNTYNSINAFAQRQQSTVVFWFCFLAFQIVHFLTIFSLFGAYWTSLYDNLMFISCFVGLAETEPVHNKIKSFKWRYIDNFVKPLLLLVGLPFGRLGLAWLMKRNLHPAQLHQYSMLGRWVVD